MLHFCPVILNFKIDFLVSIFASCDSLAADVCVTSGNSPVLMHKPYIWNFGGYLILSFMS